MLEVLNSLGVVAVFTHSHKDFHLRQRTGEGQGRDREGTGKDVKLHLTSGGKAARTELTLVAPATELVFRTGRVAPATAAAARSDSPCFSPDSDAAAEEAGD